MLRITVSGHPGSGTSTLVKALMAHYSWTSLNGGDVFRQEAARREMSLGEFGELCKSDLNVDRELDKQLQQQMQDDSSQIVESRLAGWWAYRLEIPCVRLWLDVDETERAKRVVYREGGSIEDALEANKKRSSVDAERFMELYQILPEQREPYTTVLDATNLGSEEVLAAVISILEEKA
ncbi:MAG: AAA family ATPase [Euryarchaeota archaeon]|jgi:cytidylate kinase|nr:AAA family ATPase [Euryarchaeota archaeon]